MNRAAAAIITNRQLCRVPYTPPARFPGRRYARVGGDRLRQATTGSDNDASFCRPSGMRRRRRPHPVDVGGRVSAAACLA